MFSFNIFKSQSHLKNQASDYYFKIVSLSRQPLFYNEMNVPDSFDGRFEILTMHVACVTQYLQELHEKNKSREKLRIFYEVMFQEMDRMLREMAVSDQSVPKKMKRITQAFYGRMEKYLPLIEANDQNGLAKAFSKNIYASDADVKESVDLVKYCLEFSKSLSKYEDYDFLKRF